MANKRYEFGGFVFGSEGQAQVIIRTLKENGVGYTAEFALELTIDERQELIKHLLTIADKDNK